MITIKPSLYLRQEESPDLLIRENQTNNVEEELWRDSNKCVHLTQNWVMKEAKTEAFPPFLHQFKAELQYFKLHLNWQKRKLFSFCKLS